MSLRPEAKNLSIKTVLIVAVFSFCCLGCEKISSYFPTKKKSAPPTVEGTSLAKINDYTLTIEDFNQRLKNLSELSTDLKLDTLDAKKDFLNELISQELLFQEAEKLGLANNKDINAAAAEFRKTLIVRKFLEQQLGGATVESKDIEDYYNVYKEQFREPEERRVRELVVKGESIAKDLLVELLRGGDFTTLARANSVANSKDKGGDLGFIKRGEHFIRFDEIAFSLDIGEVSNVFKCPDGYYIIKLEDKKGGKLKSLSEVWDELKNGLTMIKQRQAYQDLVSKLRAKSKLQIQEELLR